MIRNNRTLFLVVHSLAFLMFVASALADNASQRGKDAASAGGDADVAAAMVESLEQTILNTASVHGYYDFEFLDDNRTGTNSSFRQHHISLFISEQIEEWKFFSELEFEDGVVLEGSGGPAEGSGAVVAETAWGEYKANDQLTIRAGKILMPQFWQTYHYPSIRLSTQRPLLVKKLFPADFAGIMAYGSQDIGGSGVKSDYNVYLGNGVSDQDNKTDSNDAKAIGFRTGLRGSDMLIGDDLAIHLDYYRDNAPGETIDVWGADIQYHVGFFELLMEYASRSEGDVNGSGFYVQPAVNLDDKYFLWYRYDDLNLDNDAFNADDATMHTVGVTWRPIDRVSLKFEYFFTQPEDNTVKEDYEGLATSLVLFF